MSKSHTDRSTDSKTAAIATPSLSPSVRRHLGRNLRTHYADALTQPVNERIETLLGRLEKPER